MFWKSLAKIVVVVGALGSMASVSAALTRSTVEKQWAKAGRGGALFGARTSRIKLKGEAKSTYNQFKDSGWSPKVVSLGTKTVTGRKTVGVYVVEDKGSQLFVFDRKTGGTIAQGHENDVSPTMYFSK